MNEAHDPYGALRYRDYRFLLFGGVIATMGSEMLAVAVGWELYQRTRAEAELGLTSWAPEAALGLAGLVQFLPVLLFSLPAGQAADHFSRKRMLQCAQLGMVCAALGLFFLSTVQGPIPLIYVCLFLAGTGRAFNAPARQSMVPQVVPPNLIGNAVTWNSTGWQIANVSGPALGGLVIWLGEASDAFVGTALCSVTNIVLLGFIQVQRTSRPRAAASLASLLAGIRFVWRTKLLLAAITLDLFAVLLGGAMALLPVFAEEILKIGPTGLGLLRAAPAVGAFAMAMTLAHRPPLKRAGPAMLAAVAGFGVAIAIFGLSRNAVLSFAMLFLTGALDNISVVVRHTLVQVLTPDEMRGRVAAVNVVFISSSNELGAFESGVTADLFNEFAGRPYGAVISVVVGGIGTILVVLVVTACWPQLWRLGEVHKAAEPVPSPPPEEPRLPAT